MLDVSSLLTEWESEIQQLELAIQHEKAHQQLRRLRLRLRTAYQSRALLTGLGQQLLA